MVIPYPILRRATIPITRELVLNGLSATPRFQYADFICLAKGDFRPFPVLRLPAIVSPMSLKRFFSAFVLAAFLYPASVRALVSSGENASDELGQFASTTSDISLNYTQGTINNNAASPNALGFDAPNNSAIDPVNHRLFVADADNNRVLVYNLNTDNSISTASGGHTASHVLGQTNFTNNGEQNNTDVEGQSGFVDPLDLAFDAVNNRLFVADYGNGRVLVFSTSSISNGMNASYVLGNSDFTGDGGGTTQSGLHGPVALAYDTANTRLFVADSDDNRVLVYNVATGTIANGENASYVLGQTTFTASGTGHSQSKLDQPDALAYDPVFRRLFVADNHNNRVMVFNNAPGTIANGENASNVLGVTTFAAGAAGCNQSQFGAPGGVAYDPNQSILYVGDWSNDRVLVFKTIPAYIANGENALYVLGQPNFTTCTTSQVTQNTLGQANYLMYDPGSQRLFVDDLNDNRVMIFDGGTLPSGDWFNP